MTERSAFAPRCFLTQEHFLPCHLWNMFLDKISHTNSTVLGVNIHHVFSYDHIIAQLYTYTRKERRPHLPLEFKLKAKIIPKFSSFLGFVFWLFWLICNNIFTVWKEIGLRFLSLFFSMCWRHCERRSGARECESMHISHVSGVRIFSLRYQS